MLKIISGKKLKKLEEIKVKYEDLTGQRWYVITGGRTLQSRLMQLSKESLINTIMELRNDLKKEYKKLKKQSNTRVEEVDKNEQRRI